MFYKKSLPIKSRSEKEFEFDMFAKPPNTYDDETQLKVGEAQKVYNFISADGTLKSGYGFKKLAMPTSKTNLTEEVEVVTRGQIKALWQLQYYDKKMDDTKYYLLYFNEEKYVCYDNMFENRYEPFIIITKFTEVPFVCQCRKDLQDALLLSGNGAGFMVVTGSSITSTLNAEKIISCCNHYGKLFAITAQKRGCLVYNEDINILEWSDEKTKDLDFGDSRGDLNKIISFNDYLYIFRDFGITKVSQFGKDELFEINNIYLADSHIYPNTIAEMGENIYFLEGSKLRVFNGSSVKTETIDCLNILNGCDNRYAYGVGYDGKYYLACRCNFNDDQVIGCESENDYKNNTLIVYDTFTKHIDIMRGVDINMLIAFKNKYKSKVLACFRGQNINKLGQLTFDGSVFGNFNEAVWQSGKTDFGINGKLKRIKSFLIKSISDCTVTFESERGEKTFNVKGKDALQNIKANVLGNQFIVKINSKGSQNTNISNFVVTVSCG